MADDFLDRCLWFLEDTPESSETRLRMFIQRYNDMLGRSHPNDDLLDPDDLETAILICFSDGLDANEREFGLYWDGKDSRMMTLEQAEAQWPGTTTHRWDPIKAAWVTRA
jgi:hypothetical protein